MDKTVTHNEINSKLENFYKSMLRIRKTEESLLDLFSKGELFGTTHTSIGQEANSVAVLSHLKEGDVVYSNHRCHGHYLAYGGPMKEFFAEVMGKVTGVVGGRGGSQHLCYKSFFSNGIQGGIVGNAVGAALALKKSKESNLAIVFLGDGTMGEGLVYESFNFAGLWKLPILFVIENNRYAQTTPIEKALSGSLIERAKSFGIESKEIESNDVVELYEAMAPAFEYIRENNKPFVQIINTYRTVPHSKGDDFRDEGEINSWKEKDPIKLIDSKINPLKKEEIYNEVVKEVNESINWARNCELPTIKDIEFENIRLISPQETINYFNNDSDRVNGVEALNKALHQLLGEDTRTLLIGEDILDPYGGAFKVAKDLSSRFTNQVLTTPISEAGITALAIGMAKQGFKPIVEIMFGDFLTLTLDQLVNHAAKYKWMYNNKVNVPLVMRTPMGGKRGYGPTHSQSLEKLFLGIPGLTVVAASKVFNPGELLIRAVKNNTDPILFIENKSLYTEQVITNYSEKYNLFDYRKTDTRFPTVHLSLNKFKKPDYTFITYGGNVALAIEAVKHLMIEEEINVDIIVPSLISPLPIDEIIEYLGESNKVIIIEEGTEKFGWGAEVLSQLNEKINLKKGKRIGALECPIPSSKPLELELLPNVDKLIKVVKEFEVNG